MTVRLSEAVAWVSSRKRVSVPIGVHAPRAPATPMEPRQMTPETLTFHSVDVRAVVLKLRRPVVAKIATITEWPLILIDLKTKEGVVGRSYLEPYIVKSMNYLVPALRDMGAMLKGQKLAPTEIYETARKSLHFVGYEGMTMIAVVHSARRFTRPGARLQQQRALAQVSV